MNDIQIVVVRSRGVHKFMIMIRWHSNLSFFCYYAFFSKIGLRFWSFSAPMCIIKHSLGLHLCLSVYDNKAYAFLINGASIVGLAVNGSSTKDVSDLNE